MIPGTSEVLSKSGPVDLLTITKILQKYKKKYGIILGKIIYVNLGLTKFRKFLNSGPTKHLFVLKAFWLPHPQNKLVSPSVFKEFFGGGILVF